MQKMRLEKTEKLVKNQFMVRWSVVVASTMAYLS